MVACLAVSTACSRYTYNVVRVEVVLGDLFCQRGLAGPATISVFVSLLLPLALARSSPAEAHTHRAEACQGVVTCLRLPTRKTLMSRSSCGKPSAMDTAWVLDDFAQTSRAWRVEKASPSQITLRSAHTAATCCWGAAQRQTTQAVEQQNNAKCVASCLCCCADSAVQCLALALSDNSTSTAICMAINCVVACWRRQSGGQCDGERRVPVLGCGLQHTHEGMHRRMHARGVTFIANNS